MNNGMYIAGLTDDFDKEKRPQGGGPEIGADELVQKTGKSFSWMMLLFE